MEIFSADYQRKLLEKIISFNKKDDFCVLGNLIDDWVYPNIFIELISKTDCPIYIRRSYFDQIEKEFGLTGIKSLINELNDKLFELVVFLQRLKGEEYIRFSGDFDIKTIGSRTTVIDDGEEIKPEYILYTLEDKEIVTTLYEFARKKIKITEKLVEFQKNGYKTHEQLEEEIKQKREEKAQKRDKLFNRISLVSLIITALGLIFSNIWEYIKLHNTQKIEITNDTLRVKTNCCNEKPTFYFPTDETVYFEFDSCGILPSTKTNIESIIKIINSRQDLNVILKGHTDSIGSETYNQNLSLKRAQMIAEELVNRGINKDKIKITAMGKGSPLVSNKTYYGRWTNRRVEIILVENNK
jgi:outer membrane protein OmpA-like peptidoglycan-associated protein